ncbi:KamA family radical SAM protein [Thiorhodospira sibirica]|uniref:KamA family radical SAM protein n=1 Tax=Thiorhodospira sibirica TaxID=154347 RepID=UPI00022C4C66|nr:hypothetical protein [Thiorhodospira sibirica]
MNSVLKFQYPAHSHRESAPPFKVYTERTLHKIPALARLPEALRFEIQVVASVLPFRVNEYVLNELIDWDDPYHDPMFRLVFPQREMLEPADFAQMAALHQQQASREAINALASRLRQHLNPHPAGQLALNRPQLEGDTLEGVQHKYRETVLFFPTQGQTCHSYCTFCFRWAQFIGDKTLRIASNQVDSLLAYLRQHPEVSDVLITGGDPLVMKTKTLAQYLEPLLHPEFAHIQSIRIGTKALTFWPQRFVSDADGPALRALLERLVRGGKHVALMAHYNHWREMETPMAEQAIKAVRETGVEIRTQGPLLAHINDDPATWARLWRRQVHLGMIPYYCFVQRDTGARRYFEVPLARAAEIYREAMQQVSGLARTARGPSMSAEPGKVEVQGVAEIHGERVFVLRFLQARNPAWVQRPFFARYDPHATWLSDLKPAFGEARFFFEQE